MIRQVPNVKSCFGFWWCWKFHTHQLPDLTWRVQLGEEIVWNIQEHGLWRTQMLILEKLRNVFITFTDKNCQFDVEWKPALGCKITQCDLMNRAGFAVRENAR